jgi:hypothetical protein
MRLINLYSAGHLTGSVFMEVVHNYYFLSGKVINVKSFFPSLKVYSFFGESNYIKHFHLEAKTARPARIKEMGHNLTVKLKQDYEKMRTI